MLRTVTVFFIVITILFLREPGWASSQEDLPEDFNQALAEGNKSEVARFLSAGIGVDVRNDEKQTPLMLACQHGYKDIVRLLLDNKASLTARDMNGATPLMFAAWGGDADVVRLLLERHSDVNATNSNGWTPLMYAVSSEKPEVIRLLLASGARVNASDKEGETALLKACDSRAVMSLLVENGADTRASDAKGNTLLIRAVKGRHIAYDEEKDNILETIRFVIGLTKNLEVRNKVGNTALIAAYESEEILEVLINAGADVNARNFRGETALMLASGGNYYESANVLLSHGADASQVDNGGHTALWHAVHCANDCSTVEKILITAGAPEQDKENERREFPCGEIASDLTLALPGEKPVRQLVFLPSAFSSLQVLLKSDGICRLVLEDHAVNTYDLPKRVTVQKGGNPDYPDVVLKKRRPSLPKDGEDYYTIYVWNGTVYQRKGLQKAADLNRSALGLLAKGKLTEAIALLQEAYDLVEGNNIEMVNNLGFAYYKLGIKSRDKKSFESAERYLRETIYRDKKRWQAHLNIADLYDQIGRKDEAWEHYQKAIELTPNKNSADNIRKKMSSVEQRVDKPVQLAVVREKINPKMPVFGFRLLGDAERKVLRGIIITDTSRNKVIQELCLEDDYEEIYLRPGVDYFSLNDINFDGYKDIGLLVGCGMAGNCETSFWLFEPASEKFVFSKDFDGLGTLTLDPERKQINTHDNGGHAGMIYSKSTYEVRNNKPVMIREVDQNYDDIKGYYVETTRELVNDSMKETGRRIVPGR